jgi:hypothetical protein
MVSWPVLPWDRAELGRSAVSTFGLPWRQKDGSAGVGVVPPPVDGDVIDRDAAFSEQFLHVAVGQAVAQVSADREGDHLPHLFLT